MKKPSKPTPSGAAKAARRSVKPRRPAFRVDGVPVLSAMEEHRLKQENTALRRELQDAVAARVLDENFEQFVRRYLERKVTVPAWTRPPARERRHEVIPVACFSDWHLDEVVRPEEIQHKNGYNRQVAEVRLELYFQNLIKVLTRYLSPGFRFPGLVFPMLGDNFSGFIHEELKQTNADVIFGSLLHWLPRMAAGLRLLADVFGQVWVPVVVGNHGRNTRKPIMKMRARDNLDWLFAHLLRRELENAGETRVQFCISDGQKLQFSVYHTRFLASHGDEAKGGSGIAGMLSPQLIAMSRMKKTYDFDLWLLGHWHYQAAYRSIRVNGSGKGYDEYAAISNFDFQVPLQDCFLVAPRQAGHLGVIADWPIMCQSPDEPWVRDRAPAQPFQVK